MIDGATNTTQTVSVGSESLAVAVNPVTNKIYVANSGANSVSAIDMTTRKEVARIPVGEVPKRNATVVIP